jgi:hypothetical protein
VTPQANLPQFSTRRSAGAWLKTVVACCSSSGSANTSPGQTTQYAANHSYHTRHTAAQRHGAVTAHADAPGSQESACCSGIYCTAPLCGTCQQMALCVQQLCRACSAACSHSNSCSCFVLQRPAWLQWWPAQAGM